MLPKKYRLKKNSAFTATYKNHHIISDDFVCMYLGKENYADSVHTRFAFVVSKKINKRAVVRNKIKRLMRESVRLFLKNNIAPVIYNKYMSIILVAKESAVNASFYTINSSLSSLLLKL